MSKIEKDYIDRGIPITEMLKEDRLSVTMCAMVWMFWTQESLKPFFRNLSYCVIIAHSITSFIIIVSDLGWRKLLLCCCIVFVLHLFLNLAAGLASAVMSFHIVHQCKCYLADKQILDTTVPTTHLHEVDKDEEPAVVILELHKKCYLVSLSSVKKLAGEL